ncbi:endocuticle structural glycoprotein ABD-5-like isoform X3 [Anopheles funestus]|uniref:endocuticle structural glycoprotein ABD-5-like isoform X1 n=1 Tax=Anopheles funestus TaxID=62324 RepID=UPI0020C6B36A|nr:endocuticle structural glycoprotein ABD-5-like isoform X1 [Anopheles funestus]XP_049298315.1 endocuticle structural glycoprotein ABD-5-like isoform X2 [Anopheles funestus]XP_049298316.1 endocuticle structural glycoprotein ABD-5-like isoform X3 [Anopheles funestus]
MNHKICLKVLLVTFVVYSAHGAPAQGVDPNLKSFYHDADDTEQMFSYRTNDGQAREETTSWDPQTGKLVISGWYRYVGPDGVFYTVQYVADENGFQPLGAHLPGADPNPDLYTISTPFSGGISKSVLLSLVG